MSPFLQVSSSQPTLPLISATPGTSPCHSARRQGAHSTGKLAFFCHFLNKKNSKNSKVRQLPADMADMADFSAWPGRQHGITAEIIRPSQSQQVCVMILMARSVRFGLILDFHASRFQTDLFAESTILAGSTSRFPTVSLSTCWTVQLAAHVACCV